MSIYIWLRFRRFFFEMTLKNRFSFNFSPLIIFLNQALVVMNYFMITGVWWKRFLVPLMPSDKDFGTLNKRVNLSYSLRDETQNIPELITHIFQFIMCLWIFLNLKMVEIIISQFKTNILNFSVTAEPTWFWLFEARLRLRLVKQHCLPGVRVVFIRWLPASPDRTTAIILIIFSNCTFLYVNQEKVKGIFIAVITKI